MQQDIQQQYVKKMQEGNFKLTKNNAYLEAENCNDSNDSVEMFNVSLRNTVEPILINVKINGILVKMELDFGAGISILPEDLF